jgi:DNA modification methylase
MTSSGLRTINFKIMTIYKNIKELESVGQLSANSLVNADCLEAMKYIADKSIDCIIADLPYG